MRKPTLVLALLCLSAWAANRNPTHGHFVSIATAALPDGPDEDRRIVAMAMPGRKANLNREAYNSYPEAAARLRAVLRYRAVRVILVKAHPDVPWGDFLQMLDRLSEEVDGAAILTPQVEALSHNGFVIRFPFRPPGAKD